MHSSLIYSEICGHGTSKRDQTYDGFMVVMKTAISLLWVVGVLVSAATPPAAAAGGSQALPGCDEWCGDLRIPYPFGTREGCYLNDAYFIACNQTYNPPKPFLTGGDINVTHISTAGELHILQLTATDCYTKNGSNFWNIPNLELARFTISNTKNKFTAIGCDTIAFIRGQLDGSPYRSGCMSLCDNITTVKDGSCSGSGCCQLEIPRGLRNLEVDVQSFDNHTKVFDFNPCSYGFVVEEGQFNFSSKFIRNFPEEKVPMVLDWAISNDTCLQAENKTNCICGLNSRRVSFLNHGSEYRCECLKGYEGNPYLPQGCQDIDECKDKSLHDCKYECVNIVGNYTCICPKDHKGDGRRGGDGCTPNSKYFIQIIVGIIVSLTVLLIGSIWSYLGYKKWRFIKLKERFFELNGGSILQQHLSKRQSGPTDMVKIFTQEELKKATNNYDETAIVGKGGYGTVYKGVLDDGRTVAIKKSKLIDQSQTAQFINEVIVLSQINHRNVVRLLGCCLETEVPLLVYEFITNGTLFDYIHNKSKSVPLSWEARLRIASETAGVLSYLHSSASTPIIHRDIKPTNILLDDHYTAKVSDFGASKLVPLDQTQLSTMVQGTLGYLDPEYLLTSELTEKSDVYSFGIVLLELLTGKKAISFDGPEVERNLAMYVLCAMKEDRLKQVVEMGIMTGSNFEQIKEAAELAKKCLRIKGDERPTMKEVAMELEGLRLMAVHPWVDNSFSADIEEVAYLLDGTLESSQFVVNGTMTTMNDSITTTEVISQISGGR